MASTPSERLSDLAVEDSFLEAKYDSLSVSSFSRYCSSLSNSTLSESEAKLLLLGLCETFRDLIEDSISNRLCETLVKGNVFLNLLVEFCFHFIKFFYHAIEYIILIFRDGYIMFFKRPFIPERNDSVISVLRPASTASAFSSNHSSATYSR